MPIGYRPIGARSTISDIGIALFGYDILFPVPLLLSLFYKILLNIGKTTEMAKWLGRY